MWRNLNLFVYRTVVAVPKANNVVIAASHHQIFVSYVYAGYIPFVRALDLLTSQKLVSLLRMRQTKICNFALPTRGDEPKTSLVATESYICDLLFQIQRFVSLPVEQDTAAV